MRTILTRIQTGPLKADHSSKMSSLRRTSMLHVSFIAFNQWVTQGKLLPLIEILKFDWLRQILYAAILCFLTNLIFLIYPLHVTYWPHNTFLNLFHVILRGIKKKIYGVLEKNIIYWARLTPRPIYDFFQGPHIFSYYPSKCLHN